MTLKIGIGLKRVTRNFLVILPIDCGRFLLAIYKRFIQLPLPSLRSQKKREKDHMGFFPYTLGKNNTPLSDRRKPKIQKYRSPSRGEFVVQYHQGCPKQHMTGEWLRWVPGRERDRPTPTIFSISGEIETTAASSHSSFQRAS